MKKIYLGLLALSLTGMLAACGGSSNKDYAIKEGDSVLSEQLIQANYNQNKELKKSVKLQKTELEIPEGYSLAYEWNSYGLYQYKRLSDNKYGVFSLLANKFLIDTRLEDGVSDAESDPVFGSRFTYKDTDNRYYLADGAGNVIYKSKSLIPLYNIDAKYKHYVDSETGKESLYSCYKIIDSDVTPSTVYKYFSYDENNVASPSNAAHYYNWEINEVGEVPENENMVMDLSEVGLEGTLKTEMVRVENEVCYTLRVFNNSGEETFTYELPNGYSMFSLGKRVYFQHVTGVDGLREIETRYLDLEKLKDYSVELPALIESTKELEGVENTEHKYFAVSLRELSEGRYGARRMMIMDEEGEFHDDITRKNFVNWLRLDSGYFYDTNEGVLYDTEFKPVFYAQTNDYEFDATHELFFRSVNDYYDYSTRYIALNNKGQAIFDNKVILTSDQPAFNSIYPAKNTENGQDLYANVATGETFALALDSGKGKTKVVETPVCDGDLIEKIVYQYEDEERTTEIDAKRSGSLRTLDGDVLVDVDEKLFYFYPISTTLEQEDYRKDPMVAYSLYYQKGLEEGGTYLASNKLLTASAIAAPVPNN